MRLPTKDPSEKKLLRFPYSGEMDADETIVSAVVSVSVHSGTDASPAALLDGAAVIDAVTREVRQRVQGGVDGVEYRVRCLATSNASLIHLVSALLPVKTQ